MGKSIIVNKLVATRIFLPKSMLGYRADNPSTTDLVARLDAFGGINENTRAAKTHSTAGFEIEDPGRSTLWGTSI